MEVSIITMESKFRNISAEINYKMESIPPLLSSLYLFFFPNFSPTFLMFAISSSLKHNDNDSTINDIAPASPCLSTSSITSSVSLLKKTPTELIPMLKNAYSTIKDRENGNR